MDTREAITSRRSIRAFQTASVPVDIINDILHLSARAPSAVNFQPWKTYVVAGPAKDDLCQAVLAAEEKGETELENPDYPLVFRREPYLGRRRKVGWDMYGLAGIEKGDKVRMRAHYLRNFTFFDAPVGIFFTYDHDLGMGALLDLGMFIQTVMVVARDHGLHTCAQQCWLQFHKVVAEQLDIPAGESLACALALGYADEDAIINTLESEREPVDAFNRFIGF
jgi:nitroreductase